MRPLMAALVAVFVLAGPRAHAATADGTLITNLASATYGAGPSQLEPGILTYAVSYGATAWVLVASPNVQLQKTVAPTVACSGGTVTFCLSAVNASLTTSAFNVTLWDKLTTEYGYVAGGQTNWNTTSGAVAVIRGFVYGTLSGPGQIGTTGQAGCAGTLCNGPSYGAPQTGTPCPCPENWSLEPPMGAWGPIWMKWSVPTIGPGKSAMICFQASLL